MNAPDTSHTLAPELVLRTPPSFVVRSGAQGLTAIESGSGVTLSILLKSSAIGAPDDDRLLESAMALVQKKHTGAVRLGVPVPITAAGCRGRCALLQGTSPDPAVHLVLTTLIVPDPALPAQQRNLIGVLEVPTAIYAQRPTFYQQFIQSRLQVGNAAKAPAAPTVLELAPLEEPAKPEPPAPRIEPASPAKPPAPAPAMASAARPVSRQPVAEPDDDELLASAAIGQRTLAISIALSFVARAIGNVPDVPVLLAYAISAAVLIYAISGVLRICSGFRYSMRRKLVLMFCSSVPLVGIVCWVWLSVRTTRRLRAAGFEVGLFGVRS